MQITFFRYLTDNIVNQAKIFMNSIKQFQNLFKILNDKGIREQEKIFHLLVDNIDMKTATKISSID